MYACMHISMHTYMHVHINNVIHITCMHTYTYTYTNTSHINTYIHTCMHAYIQCRWNYKNDADVREVDAGFDQHNIPYDVIWLDIEHTDGKRYMTWDLDQFPDPAGLQKYIASRGRRMIVIVDPHLKVDSEYAVYQGAKDGGLLVRHASGKDFEGHCWPGTSSWLDFMRLDVREYWAKMFEGETESLYTWIE
jgi:alpha 1,3-glucosidase